MYESLLHKRCQKNTCMKLCEQPSQIASQAINAIGLAGPTHKTLVSEEICTDFRTLFIVMILLDHRSSWDCTDTHIRVWTRRSGTRKAHSNQIQIDSSLFQLHHNHLISYLSTVVDPCELLLLSPAMALHT
jgi:hypothetical protein